MVREKEDNGYTRSRQRMVRTQIADRGIRDPRVIQAMEEVPRHRFVPAALATRAYEDCALPIGHRQTISQPYIVALVLELAHLRGTERVLELGTGSGYSTLLLSRLAAEVYTFELLNPLATRARLLLQRFGCANVWFFTGDGSKGCATGRPFDVVLIWAAATRTPPVLFDQLTPNGTLIVPEADQAFETSVGHPVQTLVRYRKSEGRVDRTEVCAVSFVPLVWE